jgi:hypothetical protein
MEQKKTLAEQDYEQFLAATKNREIPYDLLIMESGVVRLELQSEIKELEIMRDQKGKAAISVFLNATAAPPLIHELFQRTQSDLVYNFLQWIMEKTEDLFYLVTIHKEKGAFFFNKDFTVMFCLQVVTPIDEVERFLKGESLQLHNITSIKQGEGKKVMKEIIEFCYLNNSPLSLWTETTEIAAYFEKYGFKNCGQLGEGKEYFMILYP